jgi:hypothetical protein
MNEAEPNVALGKVRGDAPTNADAAHSGAEAHIEYAV